MTITCAADSDLRAVLRLRILGPSGLNPPQTKVIDRLQTLSEDKAGPLADLGVGLWGPSMGLTQTPDRDPVSTQETMAEFTKWADAHGYTLRPAFEWRSADSADAGKKQHGQIVTPLITLAVYTGERLQAVYPHVDGEDVQTIHDGVEALESMAGPEDPEQADDEQNDQENPAVPLP
jgi:hypothetical protein